MVAPAQTAITGGEMRKPHASLAAAEEVVHAKRQPIVFLTRERPCPRPLFAQVLILSGTPRTQRTCTPDGSRLLDELRETRSEKQRRTWAACSSAQVMYLDELR